MQPSHEPLVIDDFNTAREVLSGDAFRVDHPFRTTRRLFGQSILDTEGDAHSHLKRAWMKLFRRPEMEGPVEPIVARAVAAGFAHAEAQGDLARICTWIPNRVILDLLDRPDLDPETHYATVRSAARMLEANRAGPELSAVRDHLRDPAFGANGLFPDLDPEQRRREIAVLLVAGVETTIVALEILLCAWVRNAQALARRIGRDGAEATVLHILRRDPPLGFAMRYTRSDTTLGDRHCPAGTILNVDIAAVRAPASWIAQLMFGRGRHQCPGKPLALRELTLVAERLASLSPADYTFSIEPHQPRPATFRHPGTIRVATTCPARDHQDA